MRCGKKAAAGSTDRRIPNDVSREKSLIRFSGAGASAREDTYVIGVFYAKFPGNSSNFYYLEIPRIESRGKKNENRAAEKARDIPRKTAVESDGGRGLDSSCTVNNTPPGRDRLAHPRHPATIYLLFVPHTFVSWPPLPSAVLRVFTAAETRGERLSA